MDVKQTDQFAAAQEISLDKIQELIRQEVEQNMKTGNITHGEQLPTVNLERLRSALENIAREYIIKEDTDRLLALSNIFQDAFDTSFIKKTEEQIPENDIRGMRNAVRDKVMELWREERKEGYKGTTSQSELLFKVALKLGIFGEEDIRTIMGLKAAADSEFPWGPGPGKDRD